MDSYFLINSCHPPQSIASGDARLPKEIVKSTMNHPNSGLSVTAFSYTLAFNNFKYRKAEEQKIGFPEASGEISE